MRRLPHLLSLVPVALLAAAAPPAPTASSPALAGHDSNAPVDVTSDHGTLASQDNHAVVYGNVHVVQGDMTLDADRVTITYTNDNGTQIKRIDASGNVHLKNPRETARSQFGIYDLDRKLVTLLGDVVLDRQDNEIRSARLVYDMNTGRANVDSGAQGGGRVSGHFTVPQSDVKAKPAAATPAPAASPK